MRERRSTAARHNSSFSRAAQLDHLSFSQGVEAQRVGATSPAYLATLG